MSESWGGSRTPANPAVVSGPGAMSARTDGGVLDPDAPEYGEGVEMGNLTSQAPMAGQGGAPAGGGGFAGLDTSGLVGLGAPGEMGLPVTAGADLGEGPGPGALGLPTTPIEERKADAQALDPAFVQTLLAAATRADATPSFRRAVRNIVLNR